MADKRKRYNQRDNDPKKEYQRLVRNTKQKMRYVRDEYGIDLSYEIEIPKFEELQSPDEFDAFVEEMSSFTDRNNLDYQFVKNKHGLVMSKADLLQAYENNEMERKNAQEFIDRFKEKEYQINGKDAGYTVGDRMTLYEKENAAGITVPDVFDFDNYSDRSRLEGRLETMEEKADGIFFDRSMRQMKENFMAVLRGSFNSESDDIVDMIDAMPEDDFFELFLQSAEFTFEDYASDGSIDGTAEQAELLRSYLKEYYMGNVDMSLKGFYLKGGGNKQSIARNSKKARNVRAKYGRD